MDTLFNSDQICNSIYNAAKLVIAIKKLNNTLWHRDVPATDGRYGPWQTADYELLNEDQWNQHKPCLYLVKGSDGLLRYVGISRNRLKDRWRLSPATCHRSKEPLPRKQLFHSQCWKQIQREALEKPTLTYEVRAIDGEALSKLLMRMGPPLSGFCTLGSDYEGLVAAVERWMCNQSSGSLITWNVAMTSKAGSKRYTAS